MRTIATAFRKALASLRENASETGVMLAGALALVASFLPFYEGEAFDQVAGVRTLDANVWSRDSLVLFPVATLIAILVIVAAVLLLLDRFADVEASVLILGPDQLLVWMGGFATLLAIVYLFQDKGDINLGVGYWLLLLAAAASLACSVLTAAKPGRTATG